MTLVYIPAGEFQMGSDADVVLSECQKYKSTCNRKRFTDEEPIHTIYLDAYWIDQTEVTNTMYAKCVADGACNEPTESSSYTRDSYYGNPEFDNYPVIYVSWDDANNYCAWAGRRLPTEAEWEKAASWNGATQVKRFYPWGDTFDGTKTNFCDVNCNYDWRDPVYNDGPEDVTQVASYLAGINFYGAYDMAGNVWEWVADWYDVYPGGSEDAAEGVDFGQTYRVIRGGAWNIGFTDVRSANRHMWDPADPRSMIGFRCVSEAGTP